MRIFKIAISGVMIINWFRFGTPKTIIIGDKVPEDAILIHTQFEKKTSSLDLYFCHSDIGSVIPEGSSMMDCMYLCPEFKLADKKDEKVKKYGKRKNN